MTRRGIDGFQDRKDCGIAPGTVLERTSDGEKNEKRGGGVNGYKHGSRSDGHAAGRRCRRRGSRHRENDSLRMGPGGRPLVAPKVRVQIFFTSLSFRGTVPACWAMVWLEHAAVLSAGFAEGFCELGTEEIVQN